MSVLAATAAGAAVWCVLAAGVAVVIGRATRTADQREGIGQPPAAEPDLLADQPTEVLSAAQIDDRFRQLVAPLSTWEQWL